MDLHEIVQKLTGPIEPAGDSSKDKQRLENLKLRAQLADQLVNDVLNVANKDWCHQASIKEAAAKAQEFIDEWTEVLEFEKKRRQEDKE